MKCPETDIERAYRLANIPSDRWTHRVKIVGGEPYHYSARESAEIARVLRALGNEMLRVRGLRSKLVKSRVQG